MPRSMVIYVIEYEGRHLLSVDVQHYDDTGAHRRTEQLIRVTDDNAINEVTSESDLVWASQLTTQVGAILSFATIVAARDSWREGLNSAQEERDTPAEDLF